MQPEPFRPVLRGMLLTGTGAWWMRTDPAGGAGEGELASHALWWPPSKIAGRWLAPYLGETDEARSLLAEVTAREPENADAWLWRAGVEAQPQLKREYFDRVLSLRPDDAEACFARALQLRPDYVTAHYNLGNVLRELGRLDEAIASYR